MRFARFRGPLKPDEKLQVDAIYTACRPLENSDVVSSPDSGIVIQDDLGQIHDIAKDTRFDYPNSVYAAVSKQFDGKRVGDVVRIEGTFTEDMYQVCADKKNQTESGMVHRDNLIVLDHTNVEIGAEVLVERADGILAWKPILAITNGLNVQVEQKGPFVDLVDCKLPVSDGDILTRPIVTCILPIRDRLLLGQHYYLRQQQVVSGTICVSVIDDTKRKNWYDSDHFTGLFLDGK